MKLHKVTVGPIVGETLPNRVRIWGRGKGDVIDDMPRRCFGAVRIRPENTQKWGNAQLFKMNPNFDMTGVAIIDKLQPSSVYEYQLAYFFSDAEMGDAGFKENDWSDVDVTSFRTGSDDATEARTLVIGSCRYLLKTFLGSFFDNRGDKTFRSILRQIDKGEQVDQIIMMGDQIYADDLNFLKQDRSVDKFYKRYRTVFGQRHIRELMSRVPTYMTLDDHEIEDNWPEKACGDDWKTLYPNAIHAYQTYQLSHSPNIAVKGTRLVETPKKLWYDYSDGCCDIFVMDSRTERNEYYDKTREIISKEQMAGVKRWLKKDTGRVKIIVTSVPFVPDSKNKESTDKWGGYEEQRIELLEHIEKHQIERVMFFSGDIHASMSLELISPTGLKIMSVISSSFFWPYPHPSSRSYKTRGVVKGGSSGDFEIANSSKVITDDNFTKLKISLYSVDIQVFSRKGKLLDKSKRTF